MDQFEFVDGAKYLFGLRSKDVMVECVGRYFGNNNLEEACKASGLIDFQWFRLIINPEADEEFKKEWDEYL